MINTQIFKTLVELAYDLEVLDFRSNINLSSESTGESETIQKTNILTSDGRLEITTTETVTNTSEGNLISYSASVVNNLKTIEDHRIYELVKSQLETEAYLSVDNYEDVICTCEIAS